VAEGVRGKRRSVQMAGAPLRAWLTSSCRGPVVTKHIQSTAHGELVGPSTALPPIEFIYASPGEVVAVEGVRGTCKVKEKRAHGGRAAGRLAHEQLPRTDCDKIHPKHSSWRARATEYGSSPDRVHAWSAGRWWRGVVAVSILIRRSLRRARL
jgi:hypothetical protein